MTFAQYEVLVFGIALLAVIICKLLDWLVSPMRSDNTLFVVAGLQCIGEAALGAFLLVVFALCGGAWWLAMQPARGVRWLWRHRNKRARRRLKSPGFVSIGELRSQYPALADTVDWSLRSYEGADSEYREALKREVAEIYGTGFAVHVVNDAGTTGVEVEAIAEPEYNEADAEAYTPGSWRDITVQDRTITQEQYEREERQRSAEWRRVNAGTLGEGTIKSLFVGHCGLCGRALPLDTPTYTGARNELYANGWQKTEAHGWICQYCAEQSGAPNAENV